MLRGARARANRLVVLRARDDDDSSRRSSRCNSRPPARPPRRAPIGDPNLGTPATAALWVGFACMFASACYFSYKVYAPGAKAS